MRVRSNQTKLKNVQQKNEKKLYKSTFFNSVYINHFFVVAFIHFISIFIVFVRSDSQMSLSTITRQELCKTVVYTAKKSVIVYEKVLNSLGKNLKKHVFFVIFRNAMAIKPHYLVLLSIIAMSYV